MEKIRFDFWNRLCLLSLIVPFILSACGGSSSSSPISSFNLLDIDASDNDVKQMIFNWTSASSNSGVTYSICERDSTRANNCNVLVSVSDTLQATVNVSSLVSALTADYFIMASDGTGQTVLSNEKKLTASNITEMIGYYKASNTGINDGFGYSIALSGDGKTMVVGARDEDNNISGIITDGSEVNDTGTATNSGAVYLFHYNAGSWTQSAYLKASNSDSGDFFGYSVAVSDDGNVVVVGAPDEDNSASGVITNGSETTDAGVAFESGAVYLFTNSAGNWVQSAYIKASNTGAYDEFGRSVSLSGDGTALAVAALGEDNDANGIITDGSETTDSNIALGSGAVYLFNNNSGLWSQSAYFKASNSDSGDFFGHSIALNEDGSSLIVGARDEDNGAVGVITDGSETTDSGLVTDSGAAYLYSNSSGNWTQTAYFKASNTDSGDYFGHRVALSDDGSTLVVAALNEDNGAAGIIVDGSEVSDTGILPDSGALYLFSNSGGNWAQTAYVKASNSDSSDYFGTSVALNSDGTVLAAGGYGEDNSVSGILTSGPESVDTESKTNSGAVYLFRNGEGTWTQTAYLKASNSGIGDFFGISVAISHDAKTLAVGANNEDNSAKGIITNGSEVDDIGMASNSGAVYLY